MTDETDRTVKEYLTVDEATAVGLSAVHSVVSRQPDWQVTTILADGLFIETDCNSGKTSKIRTTKCDCGKAVEIEYNAQSCRADKKRVYHPEDKESGWCLFRCKSCGEPVNESVPGAEYGD